MAMNSEMTVLDVLVGGGQVSLHSGILLKSISLQLPEGLSFNGASDAGYIVLGYEDMAGDFVSKGHWSLSKDGLECALKEAEQIAGEGKAEE